MPADTADVAGRLQALELLVQQQHFAWVDHLRPALAVIIDKMGEITAAEQRAPGINVRGDGSGLFGGEERPAGWLGPPWKDLPEGADEAEMAAHHEAVDQARKRLRDACQTYTADGWRPVLEKFALAPKPGAKPSLPLPQLAHALLSLVADKAHHKRSDCELVYKALSDHSGAVDVDAMAEFLHGPGHETERKAASRIQSRQRGKVARRRVTAKLAHSLADCVAVDEGEAQQDERWRRIAQMSPDELLTRVFRQIDSNHSGSVTRKELRKSRFAEPLQKHWKALNTNKDKSVSVQEWEEFWGEIYHKLGEEHYARTVVDMAWQGELHMPSDDEEDDEEESEEGSVLSTWSGEGSVKRKGKKKRGKKKRGKKKKA